MADGVILWGDRVGPSCESSLGMVSFMSGFVFNSPCGRLHIDPLHHKKQGFGWFHIMQSNLP